MKNKFEHFYDWLCDVSSPILVALFGVCIFFLLKIVFGFALVDAEGYILIGSLALAFFVLVVLAVCSVIEWRILKKGE